MALVNIHNSLQKVVYQWQGLTAGVAGEALDVSDYPDKTFQTAGTFGGNVTMQGSSDGINWLTLKNVPDGDDIVFAAAGDAVCLQNHRFIRPDPGAGVTLVNITVTAVR